MILSGELESGRNVYLRGRGKQVLIELRAAISAAE
jgi:hypothetical protein